MTDNTLTMLIEAGKLQEIVEDAIEERNIISASSMSEQLHESMSAKEFIDLLEYLAEQETKLNEAS